MKGISNKYADGHVETLGRARESLPSHITPFTNVVIGQSATGPELQITNVPLTKTNESGLWSMLRLDDAQRHDEIESHTHGTDRASPIF
jgi:hypothetical protein